MPSQSKNAIVEQNVLNKVPVLLQGDLTPSAMCQYENACLGFFESKEIAVDKQVRKILARLHDDCIQDWISIDREAILAHTFTEFMTEFRSGFLPEDWEGITCIELLAMQQGHDSFWDFAIQVQSKNALLRDTESFFNQDQLHHHIESGMTPKLTLHCCHEKSNKIMPFKEWLMDVKRVDDLIRADHAELEILQKAQRDSTRRANTFGEPSRNTNTTASTLSAPRSKLAKLTDAERRLLFDNEGCLKCQKVFIGHQAASCPNNYPNPATYKVLTQAFMDHIKQHMNKKQVAAIMYSTNEDTPSMPTAPIAAVMGSSSAPVVYMPPNASNVIEGDADNSDDSISPPHAVAATIPSP